MARRINGLCRILELCNCKTIHLGEYEAKFTTPEVREKYNIAVKLGIDIEEAQKHGINTHCWKEEDYEKIPILFKKFEEVESTYDVHYGKDCETGIEFHRTLEDFLKNFGGWQFESDIYGFGEVGLYIFQGGPLIEIDRNWYEPYNQAVPKYHTKVRVDIYALKASRDKSQEFLDKLLNKFQDLEKAK
jgi:hypothetical protein